MQVFVFQSVGVGVPEVIEFLIAEYFQRNPDLTKQCGP